ncbi:hypothetical protein KZX46_21040 (plasmid) [Polymorphobacter sp. PAMC 29334]|uniref:hypothetical protein n=1 Tax=Polymorphobacter sp. PAMC 29334 TaxID=2862331 RepID=UPI001C784A5D|nr:hypothetical protein [Polymorphobacter sp. PAMC 29334]QYE37043.1 hypothetical protein KZX46_21040 [Polymorphobacter sp. PAMC 29334]
MIKDIAKDVISQIRVMYQDDNINRELFDQCAQRQKDASVTSLDRLSHLLGISRGEAVALARRLEEAGCGQFIVGRRGSKSRFEWAYSCISLGKAAAGETSSIDQVEEGVAEMDDEQDETVSIGPQMKLTIAEAKEALARTLGVSPTSIEIIVRG